MNSPSPEETTQTSPASSVLDMVHAVLHELREAVHGRVLLLSLELRQAALALSHMVVLAVLAALLLCTAWLTLMAGVFMAVRDAGLHWAWALGVVLIANVGGAVGLLWKARQRAEYLLFPATVRTLQVRSKDPTQPMRTEPQ
ncbi:MAG: phage holin family protein [Burkholderiales bacterium]|nr:phage holin family protein [Burkholderiales bacterium]